MFTVLALGDTKSQSVKGIVVPKKGATDPWVIKRVAGWINSLGYNSVRFRADKESAIHALAREVKIMRGDQMSTIIEEAKQGDKQSGGAGERAVRTVKDMTRTLKVMLEKKMPYRS